MKIGFIGCGNMAQAMIRGILANKAAEKYDLMASARSERTRGMIREELGILPGETNGAVAAFSDILFLAVKPQYYEEVLREIKGDVRPDTILISIAPGKSLSWLSAQLSGKQDAQSGGVHKIVRAMPNTPAMVGEGMVGLCRNENVTDEEMDFVVGLCENFGKAECVPESLMDVVTGVSGSSPAYVFLFIEALADGAVAGGMPRNQAYKFAAQAVLGSAKMVLETGMHPGALKDMVCSPGGTTIEAVRLLEKLGLRSAVMEAELACIEKSGKM